jgi:Single Cache domain 2
LKGHHHEEAFPRRRAPVQRRFPRCVRLGRRRHCRRGHGHGQEGHRLHQGQRQGQGLCRDQQQERPVQDRDLYLVVYGLDGVVRAHGANEKMVGKNLLELKDVDGKSFVKERVELAQSKGTFWQDYKFTNPVSKKIEPKTAYCEKLDDVAVCGGIYK